MIRKQVLTLALSLGCGFLSGGVAAASLYTVSSGDTLFGIAKTHNVSVSEIQNLNNLRSHRIVPGQKIKIPGSGTVTAANPTADLSYTVRRGDSLGKIATSHRISLSSLKQNNRLRSNVIHPGQILFIPNGTAARSTNNFDNSGTATVHVVTRGDSLWEISKRYRISMASLSRFNGITKNSTLVPGQRIRIPASGSLNPGGPTTNFTGYAANGVKYPYLESQSVIVVDAKSGKTLLEKNSQEVKSIASITKLMTAMVTLDAKLPLNETLTINNEDVDRLKMTSSRLPLGTKMTREEMLHLALMSSENRAASALSRHYPGGQQAFFAAMNAKARALGMMNTHFSDATGLTPKNVSTAADLAKMVGAATQYALIRKYTTDNDELVKTNKAGSLQYRNTNHLVRAKQWQIDVSKTGYIREAGRCLVMQAEIGHRPAYMVFLHSNNRPDPDAVRIRKWLESGAAGVNLAGL